MYVHLVLGFFVHPRTNRGAVIRPVVQLAGSRGQRPQHTRGRCHPRRSRVLRKLTKQTKQTKQRDNKQTGRLGCKYKKLPFACSEAGSGMDTAGEVSQ